MLSFFSFVPPPNLVLKKEKYLTKISPAPLGMDDARRMTALVVSRKKGVFSLVYSTCGHVYVMIN